ncbi:hypothetical protein BGZ61DRAFT_27872 [Ilyonectria robusta]|uniref:uncharacterized protein n=1 Tax=Ilyonectria robusta TaxID=1079257 RepID=UPI001E8EC28A|nr:uncharacterized protein BGZ61DRAFT_27872 [Ilyonectria robusta]KAH8738096.1 hypothetical protein BGZ61DRAFT_27872 [Ilyonectria robusta]
MLASQMTSSGTLKSKASDALCRREKRRQQATTDNEHAAPEGGHGRKRTIVMALRVRGFGCAAPAGADGPRYAQAPVRLCAVGAVSGLPGRLPALRWAYEGAFWCPLVGCWARLACWYAGKLACWHAWGWDVDCVYSIPCRDNDGDKKPNLAIAAPSWRTGCLLRHSTRRCRQHQQVERQDGENWRVWHVQRGTAFAWHTYIHRSMA